MRRALPISATAAASCFLTLLSASACGPSDAPPGDGGGNPTGGVSGAAGAGIGGTPGGGTAGASNGGAGATAGAASGGAAGTGTGGTLGGGSGAGGVGGNAGAGAAGASGAAGAPGGTGGDGGTGVGGAGNGGGANNALFSDGFEGASVDTTKWTPRLNGQGMLTIDASRKHSGNSSLRVQCNNAYSTLLAKEGAPIFPAPNNTYFGRVWFYVPAPLPTDHVIWLESGVVANDSHEVRIGMHLGYGQINLWQNGEVDIREPSAPMRPDAWICLEFRMGPDVLEIWMDGTRVDGLSTTNWVAANQANGNQTPRTNWAPMHAAFRLGWELNGNTREIWYDDVALGHARIGCN
jgi:hypothetical protein